MRRMMLVMTHVSPASGHDVAPHALAPTHVIELSPADQLRVALALLHPSEPTAALVLAFKQHRQLMSLD